MRMQDTVIKLLLSQPFYGSLATAISLQESKSVEKTQMTLLPSPVLKYNPDWYEELTESQAIGVVLHELLHLLLLHALRCGERDPLIWAVCCDMAVNDHLPQEMLPANAVTTEKIERELSLKLQHHKSAESYYADIARLLADSFSFTKMKNMVTLKSSNGSLLEADLPPEEDISEMNEQALKGTLRDLIDESRQGGEVPQALDAELEVVYAQAQIDWKTMFKRFLTGRGRMQSRATYKRESRRYDSFPGSKRSVGLSVLIALDESGSISNEQLQTFFHEVMAVNRITNAQILVTEFDTRCTAPKPAAEYRHVQKREMNGGTDFRPVFTLADSLKVSLVVIFTDGDGSAPENANQKVLWVLTKGGKQPAAFGYSVTFE